MRWFVLCCVFVLCSATCSKPTADMSVASAIAEWNCFSGADGKEGFYVAPVGNDIGLQASCTATHSAITQVGMLPQCPQPGYPVLLRYQAPVARAAATIAMTVEFFKACTADGAYKPGSDRGRKYAESDLDVVITDGGWRVVAERLRSIQ